jgi:hypothetical protein
MAIVHAVQLPLAHLHCTYEIADEHIAFLGKSDKGVKAFNERQQGCHT